MRPGLGVEGQERSGEGAERLWVRGYFSGESGPDKGMHLEGERQGGQVGEGSVGEGLRCRELLGAEIYISLQVIPAEQRPDKDYCCVGEESRAQREKSECP